MSEARTASRSGWTQRPSYAMAHAGDMRGVVASTLWAMMVLAMPASATATEGVALHYVDESNARCWSAQEVRNELAARVGHDPIDERASRELSVTIRAIGRTLIAQVTILEAGGVVGVRALESRSSRCDDLMEDLLLTLTFLVDTGPSRPPHEDAAPVEPGSPEPVAISPPTPPPVIVQLALQPPSAPVTETVPLVFRLHVDGAVLFGALPNVSPTLDVGASLAVGAFVLMLGARVTRVDGFSVGPGEVSVWQGLGRGLLCARFFDIDACGLVTAGAMVAEGRGFALNERRVEPFVGLGLHAGYGWVFVEHVGLHVFAELVFHVQSSDLLIDREIVWGSGDVSGAIGLGLFWEP